VRDAWVASILRFVSLWTLAWSHRAGHIEFIDMTLSVPGALEPVKDQTGSCPDGEATTPVGWRPPRIVMPLVAIVAALGLGWVHGRFFGSIGHPWDSLLRCAVFGLGLGHLGASVIRFGDYHHGPAAFLFGAVIGVASESITFHLTTPPTLPDSLRIVWLLEGFVIAVLAGGRAAREATRPLSPCGNHSVSPAGRQDEKENELRLLEDFVVDRVLGEGGMGRVTLVKSRSTGERYAVKTTLLGDEITRCNFLSELQTWTNLPSHPHLARCGFLRTMGDRTYVFSEYVDGGSLSDWIRSRKLYEGGTGKALERILDVAIQFAWGLHAAHEWGVVHQDVKPGNLLMTNDGVAKVADFGLARALAASSREVSPPGSTAASPKERQLGTVTVQGMSPAYCSPEQAKRRPVSRKTDVWSWGVSILEMFAGDATWSTGTAATFLLSDYLDAGPTEDAIPAMPASIVEILNRCFVQDPEGRWATLQDAADALKAVYQNLIGHPYPRLEPLTEDPFATPNGNQQTDTDTEWRPPQEWLTKAFRELGKGSAFSRRALPPRVGSSRARAVADLAAFEMARECFERIVASGRNHLAPELVDLLLEKALVHESLGDTQGAIGQYERAVQICEAASSIREETDLEHRLARACRRMGDATLLLARPKAALSLHDRAIDILERPDRSPLAWEAVQELARACRGKGRATELLGDLLAALATYDRTVQLLQRAASQDEGSRALGILAQVLGDKARTLDALGQVREAIMTHDAALKIRTRMASDDSRPRNVFGLVTALIDKASTLANAGRLDEVATLFDAPIASLERLVVLEKNEDHGHEVARVYVARASLALFVEDHEMAAKFCSRALEILEQLVRQQGRIDLAGDLAAAYATRCRVFMAQGETRPALSLADSALKLLVQIVRVDGRAGLLSHLAIAYALKGELTISAGEAAKAAELLDNALQIQRELVEKWGQASLIVSLARTSLARASAAVALADRRGALALFDRSLELLEDSVLRKGRWEHACELASSYAAKADGCVRFGDVRKAESLIQTAVEIQEKVVHRSPKRPGCADDLAKILLARASVLTAANDRPAAERSLDQAISIWESLVRQGARLRRRTGLYRAYTDKANIARSLGRGEEAMSLHDQADRCRGS